MQTHEPDQGYSTSNGRAVVAGASGFVGREVALALTRDGYEVVSVGRSNADVTWADTDALHSAVDGAALVVNLAGYSINARFTKKNRRRILESRTSTTVALAEAIATAVSPPPLWINASAAGVYRDSVDRAMVEADGPNGSGFLHDVVVAWEGALMSRDLPQTRRVALRITAVLGDGGAMKPVLMLARFGLGGPQLDGRWFPSRTRRAAGTEHRFAVPGGRQMLSWIHMNDVIGLVRFIRDTPQLEGPINASAPGAVTNRTFMTAVRRAVGAPFGLPAFRWMTELGTLVLRTETELLLKSRWVAPGVASAAGYQFRYPDVQAAVEQIVAEGRSQK